MPSSRLCRAAIALLAVLVWGQTIHYGFVWDDHYFIIKNEAIRSPGNIPAMFYSRIAEAFCTSAFRVAPFWNTTGSPGAKSSPQPA